MSGKAARRRAREFALQGVYQWLLSGNALPVIEEHIEQSEDFGKADGAYFVALLRGTVEQAGALQAEFAPFIHREVKELSPVEHAVLLLATQELAHHLEIPYRVVINEAIELAKSFGGTDGHRFVNGVVDKLAARLRSVEVANDRGAGSNGASR